MRDREALREELEALRDPLGRLRPQVIVDWAREHPHSELHKEFQWDIQKAAYQFWLSQARNLVAIILVEEDTGRRETFSLASDRPYGRGYRDADEVFDHAGMRAEAVEMALKELKQWRQRYFHLSPELDLIFRVIDRMTGAAPPPSRPPRSPPPPPPRGGRGGRGRGGRSPPPPA
jgi:hypothetical protein